MDRRSACKTIALGIGSLALQSGPFVRAEPQAAGEAPRKSTIGERVFWIGNKGIYSAAARKLNTDVQCHYDAVDGSMNFAVDYLGPHIYWTSGRGPMRRAALSSFDDIVEIPFLRGDKRGLAFGNGRLFYAELDVGIWEVDRTSMKRRLIEASEKKSPLYLVYDPYNDYLYWSNWDSGKVMRMHPGKADAKPFAEGLKHPAGLALGNLPRQPDKPVLYVAEYDGARVLAFDPSKETESAEASNEKFAGATEKWQHPLGLALNWEGTELFVSDANEKSASPAIWRAAIEGNIFVEKILDHSVVNGPDINDLWVNF